MTKAEFFAILDKHLDGTATGDERRLLDRFYHHHLAAQEQGWELTEKERIRLGILESLNRAIDEDMGQRQWAVTGRMWKIAASVVIVLAAGLWLYLARIAGPEIQYVTATAQRGEQLTITLPDSSVVRLNAESSITYPEQLGESKVRNVQLSGEAFFDVARDESRPFIVRSGDLLTTVLGTSFNISAYQHDETIAVTVVSGKVRIEGKSDQDQRTPELLTAGEQGLYEKSSASLATRQVNLEKYVAWKNGTILLEGATLAEATDILGRWYDVEFLLKNPALKSCTIDGKFRNDQLVNILENLRFLMGITYQIEGDKTVIIDGKSCN